MISVVMSTYNRGERLKRAIDSVLNQTYDDLELIVVDDASTDDTEALVKSYTDNRVKYLKRNSNWGNDTRPKNEGIKASQGEYIAFLDDDNTYRVEHLRILMQDMQAGDVDIVYGDRWIKGQEVIGTHNNYDMELLFFRNYIDTSDVLIKRNVLFKVGGFDERYKKYIDWNLWVRLSKAGYKFRRVPVIITDYYIEKDAKSFRVEDQRADKVPAWDPIEVEIYLPYLESVVAPKVAIYTLTWERLDYTRECLATLYETAEYEFDHYIFDNGSKDGTVEYLKSLKPSQYCKKVEVHYSEDNKGISIASNTIVDRIKEFDYQIVMKVDNDAYFKTSGWLKKMVEIWGKNNKLALSCYIEGLVDNPGGAPRVAYGLIANEVVGITHHLGGICHFVDARGYSDFRWDEDSTLHGVQDLEFSKHLAKNKYQMGYLENYFVEHKDGTSGQHAKYPEYFDRRKRIEMTKSYEEVKNETNRE